MEGKCQVGQLCSKAAKKGRFTWKSGRYKSLATTYLYAQVENYTSLKYACIKIYFFRSSRVDMESQVSSSPSIKRYSQTESLWYGE